MKGSYIIGTEGQYLYKFKVGDIEDAILEEELQLFTLIEEAGNVLPTFQLIFNTLREDIFQVLHEGQILETTFGRNSNALVTAPLSPTRMQTGKSGEFKRQIILTGVYGALDYLSSSKMMITTEKSGVAAVKDVVSKHFKPIFNVDVSQDKQKWIQPQQTDKKFVNEVWLHSYIEGSFIACGISSDGKFILKDIKKDLKQPYAWKFTNDIKDPNKDLTYDPDPFIETNTGFINNFTGYGRERIVYNLEDDDQLSVLETVDPVIAMTKQLAKSDAVSKRFAASGMQNENVHSNYWKAYHRNMSHLTAFGNVKLTLSFHGVFIPIRVLDQVMFLDDDITSQGKSRSSEFNSGVYYVAKVSRTIANRQFVTTVVLCRESLNQIR